MAPPPNILPVQITSVNMMKNTVYEKAIYFCQKKQKDLFINYILINGTVPAVSEYKDNNYEYKGEIKVKKRTINQQRNYWKTKRSLILGK